MGALDEVGEVVLVGSPVGVGVDLVVAGSVVDSGPELDPDVGVLDTTLDLDVDPVGFDAVVGAVNRELSTPEDPVEFGPTTDGDTVIGTKPELDVEAPGSASHAPTAKVPASTASNTRLDRPIPHAPRPERHPANNPEQ